MEENSMPPMTPPTKRQQQFGTKTASREIPGRRGGGSKSVRFVWKKKNLASSLYIVCNKMAHRPIAAPPGWNVLPDTRVLGFL